MPNPPTPPVPAVPAADTSSIPGYETMTFEQRRLAQDQNAARKITLARIHP
jgi:hypothetical protein